MKKGILGILIGALLLPALFAAPVLAQAPVNHPDMLASFNATRARMWTYDVNTGRRAVLFDSFDIYVNTQDEAALSDVTTYIYSSQAATTLTAEDGIGFVAPLVSRTKRFVVATLYDDRVELGSNDVIAYVGVFKLRYRDDAIVSASGPVLGIIVDGGSGAVTWFRRNLKLDYTHLI